MKAGRSEIYEATIRRMVAASLDEKHRAFDDEHRGDTDEQLLDYLRVCARELGHSPYARELIGWPTLVGRFGSWPEVLKAAGLEMPTVPNKPSNFLLLQQEDALQRKLYRERRAEKKRKRTEKTKGEGKP